MLNLQRFHSPLTKQKLSLIKPSVPPIQYSTYEEINEKFKELCTNNGKETKKKEIPQKDRRLRRATMSASSFQRKGTYRASIKLDFDTIEKSIVDNDMSKVVLQYYEKNQSMKYEGQINPVVKFFGNNLIASVFQALLIKSIEEIYSKSKESNDSNDLSSK